MSTIAIHISYRNLSVSRIPDGFVIEKVEDADMEQFIANWDFITCENVKKIVEMNRILPSMAAYKTNSDGIEKKKELASYSVFFQNGEIGSTHTIEKYRRRGLAKRIAWEITNECLKKNVSPFINIAPDNAAAIKTYQGIGYVFDSHSFYGYYTYDERSS